MDIEQFSASFFVEAAELLAQAEQLLLELDTSAPSNEQLNAIFRAAHSIKGGAATFEYTSVTQTTHLLESHLDLARQGRLTLTPAIVNLFLSAKDALQQQLSAYSNGKQPNPADVARICDQLKGLKVEEGATAQPASQVWVLPEPGETVRLRIAVERLKEADRDLLLIELGNLGKVVKSEVGPSTLTVSLETSCVPEDITGVCCFVINEDQIQITRESAAHLVAGAADASPPKSQGAAVESSGAANGASTAPKETSIRVDVDKVDKLINLVGELVITQAMLTESATHLDPVLHERLLSGMGHLERNALDLQESVMSIRMMPVESVFSRYPRLVRDMSAKLGKQVRLDTYGKETELDRGVIQRIIDPLTHLVRNSLDHGIETPERRVALGKDATGQLLLSAQHHGGNIVIEVTDDGAGLNRERILAKALEKGFPVSEATPDEDLWQLIYAPGFSTAEQVTDISGRGVGMDVVKRNIQEMGGRVEIISKAGRGTTTRIVLPLTLAILNGMSVRLGKEIYILPLNCVVEALQPSAVNLHSIQENCSVIRVRGEYLPLIELHRMFMVEGAKTDPLEGILVIVHAGSARFALLVDELVGQHQIVVKSLETNYRRVAGISAATILGDGSVALIVDIADVQRVHGAYSASAKALAAASRRDLVTS